LPGEGQNLPLREVLGINCPKSKKPGWSLGCVSAVDCEGRTISIADAHCDDGKCFVVRADEKVDGISGIGEDGLYPLVD